MNSLKRQRGFVDTRKEYGGEGDSNHTRKHRVPYFLAVFAVLSFTITCKLSYVVPPGKDSLTFFCFLGLASAITALLALHSCARSQ